MQLRRFHTPHSICATDPRCYPIRTGIISVRSQIYLPYKISDISNDYRAVVDILHPENYKLELSSVDAEEWRDALEAVGDALDRLHFLAVAIRKVSAKRLEYDANTSLTEQDALFRQDAVSSIRRMFPEAQRSLSEQLGESIAIRRRMLLNKRRQDDTGTGPKPFQPIPVSSQATKVRLTSKIETIASRPISPESLGRHIMKPPRTALIPVRSSAPSGAEMSFEYPPPPRTEPHAKFVSCPYCFTPLEADKLRAPENNYWL
jgi:hypothetical protein